MKVLCRLPNAADVINGVKFIEHKLGKVSEEIEDSVAEHFLKIEGYLPFAQSKKAAATSSTSSTDNSGESTSGEGSKEQSQGEEDAATVAAAAAAAAAEAASKANAAK